MPRCANEGPEVNDYCIRTGEGSSTWDLCNGCAKEYEGELIINVPGIGGSYNGEPDGVLGEGCVAHPDYDDEDYDCIVCGTHLSSEDD